MSFILDALKKSESDRQRQSGPSLFEVKVAPPRRSLPIWAVAILVLLGINAVVVSWMLLRHGPARQPATASTPAASPAPAATAAAAAPLTPTAAPRASGAGRPSAISSPAGQQSQALGAGATAAAVSSAPPPAAAPEATAPAAAAATPPDIGADGSGDGGAAGGSPSDYAPAVEPSAGSGTADSAADTGSLPLYQQIVTSAGLPPLHLDLHVFADRPQDRFVMINMHRLGEGDSLPSGVRVEAIRPDGAVLSYHGMRFLLPRD